MKTLGVILMTLLMLEQSHCGVLQPDDQAFIRSEIASQVENITSPQLETVLQNQAAMMTSQAEIIRTLADVNKVFVDCLDYHTRGSNGNTSGIIKTHSNGGDQESYCDMETDGGGWTVFQRHQSDAVSFNRSWAEYKNGFGDLSDNFWWGNEKLTQALNDGRQYELRIDLSDWEGEHRYAKYSDFHVAPESDNYRLHISGYSGTAGNSFGAPFRLQYQSAFTTYDRDNDAWANGNCAHLRSGFWWYNCGLFSPNGRYSYNSSVPRDSGLHWDNWHGHYYSLKAVSMAFRAIDLQATPYTLI